MIAAYYYVVPHSLIVCLLCRRLCPLPDRGGSLVWPARQYHYPKALISGTSVCLPLWVSMYEIP